MPSSTDLIFITLLLLLTCTPLSVRLLGDAGIGWHIRTGQQILTTHSIPRIDPFSASMQGKPWFAWEWLYDVIAGQFEATAGLNGVTWLTAAVIGAVFAWTFQLLIRRATSLPIALVLTLLAASASTIHFLARPHVVSWLFTLAFFWILDVTERNSCHGEAGVRGTLLWALPGLMLVWVNVHAGFLLGFALIGIFWLGSLWTYFTTRNDRIEQALQRIAAQRRARTLTWVGLACAMASLVNPYGWHLHSHVLSYLSNRFLMDHIEEFQSPNFHGVAPKCFLVLLLIALAALTLRGRTLGLSQILTVLLSVAMSLYSSRNIPVASILIVLNVGPMLPATAVSGDFFRRMSKVESHLRGHLWPILAAILAFFIAANGGHLGSDQLMDAHFGPNRMPVAAVHYLDAHHFHGAVLAPDYWGGFLIYCLYPKTPVVVDDRHDFYGADFFQSYLRMMHVEPGWEKFLDQYRPDAVLLPRNSALAQMLLKSSGWNEIYTDDTAIAFGRGE